MDEPTEGLNQAPDFSALVLKLRDLHARKSELLSHLEELHKAQTEVETTIQAAMALSGVKQLVTDHGTVTVKSAVVPTVQNWEAVYEYIVNNNAFYLLERRMAVKAFRELTEQGEEIPGTSPFLRRTVSFTKK